MTITIRRAETHDGDAIYNMFLAVARDGLVFIDNEADPDQSRTRIVATYRHA